MNERPRAIDAASKRRDLEQRIATTLAAERSCADDVRDLLSQTEAAISAANTDAERHKAATLDLATTDPRAAHHAALDAELERDRLQSCLPELQQKLADSVAADYRSRWATDYKRVRAQRDAAAQRLRRYRELLAELLDIFAEVQAVDAAIQRVNSAAPDSTRLAGVELHARNLQQFSREQPSLLKVTQLAEWEYSAKQAWPPRPKLDMSLFQPVPFNPAYSPRWHENAEAKAAERQSEAKRVADYYSKQQREREQREEEERQRGRR